MLLGTGTTGTSLSISTLQDALLEGSENIDIEIVGISGPAIEAETQQATVSIIDDEVPVNQEVILTLDSSSMPETSGVITITTAMSGAVPAATGVVVTIQSVAGTATSGDYSLASTTLVIPVGATGATTTVSSVSDAVIEGTEQFSVEIVSVSNANEAGVQSETISIVDDDGGVREVVLESDPSFFVENGGTTTVTARISGDIATT